MEGLTRRITPLANHILFDYTLPTAALVTYFRLQALACSSDFRTTGTLSLEAALAPLLGVRRSQLREHLRLLRIAKLLDWRVLNGSYTFNFLQAGPPIIHSAVIPDSRISEPELLAQVSDAQNQPENAIFLEIPASESGFPDSRPANQAESGKPARVVVVDSLNSLNTIDQNQQQQQTTQTGNPDSRTESRPDGFARDGPGISQPELAVLAGMMGGLAVEELVSLLEQPAFSDTIHYLTQAGVWTERVMSVARQVYENELREARLLPTRADVLGWIAYCFAFGKDNNIQHPAHVLSVNLAANRRCPDPFRPPRICLACQVAEDYCECQGQPQYAFMDEFLERALTPRNNSPPVRLWGVCGDCQGFPCQCG